MTYRLTIYIHSTTTYYIHYSLSVKHFRELNPPCQLVKGFVLKNHNYRLGYFIVEYPFPYVRRVLVVVAICQH